VRQVIADLHKEITGDDLPTHSFRKFAASWLERKAPEGSVGHPRVLSRRNYQVHLVSRREGGRGPAEITTEDVVAFRNQQAKTLAPKDGQSRLESVRMLFRAARRDKVLVDDPCEFVSVTKKGSVTRRRPFHHPRV